MKLCLAGMNVEHAPEELRYALVAVFVLIQGACVVGKDLQLGGEFKGRAFEGAHHLAVITGRVARGQHLLGPCKIGGAHCGVEVACTRIIEQRRVRHVY